MSKWKHGPVNKTGWVWLLVVSSCCEFSWFLRLFCHQSLQSDRRRPLSTFQKSSHVDWCFVITAPMSMLTCTYLQCEPWWISWIMNSWKMAFMISGNMMFFTIWQYINVTEIYFVLMCLEILHFSTQLHHCTLCAEKKHPFTFSFISPWKMFRFTQNFHGMFMRN